MGASTVLIEQGAMGGDCLNVGCVPSKALIAAGHVAAMARRAGAFGVDMGPPVVDGRRVHDHVHGVIAAIAPHDSVERFEGLGVTVIRAHARFTGPREVTAGGRRIAARRFVIATGSVPALPPLPGLHDVPFLTNETMFDRDAIPGHLIIIGGGPIGVEMAQAHRRLGAAVTLLETGTILSHDDPELVAVVRERLIAEGVDIREGARVAGVAPTAGGIRVSLTDTGGAQHPPLSGSHLLVATGRRPVTEGLDLERAGVAYSKTGITVDRRLRTSNRRIYAVGDVIGGLNFTHVASHHAGIVLQNALFRLPAKVAGDATVPHVTYCDPELAQVGLTEAAARDAGHAVTVLRASFADNDRARTERADEGLAKIIVGRRGRILGAGVVGAGAGDLIQPWVLARSAKLKIGSLATMIAPYPTRGEIGKSAAGAWYTPTLFGERTRRLVRFLAHFG
jgi:pyruvate/2-oxoglutarate dehydrogenase complex dihydrolipoamide dehydrogenase (E3) component